MLLSNRLTARLRPLVGGLFNTFSTLAGRTRSPVTEELWKLRQQIETEQAANSGISGSIHANNNVENTPPFLLQKQPKESAVSVSYNFSSDPELKYKYTNAFGSVRMGMILEDLDATAGTIAFKHADDNNPETRPLWLVTASVDEIRLLRPFPLDDVSITGQVTWVGSSSMEIRVEIHPCDNPTEPILVAFFTFVARDKTTGRAAKINTLSPENAKEKQWFIEASERAAQRKLARKAVSKDATPTEMEAKAQREMEVDAMVVAARPLAMMPALAPMDTLIMSDTILRNTLICQPQHQNTAGKVFGGFLMRRAFEIAFANGYVFSGTRPGFDSVDQVDFKVGVDVGTLLQFESKVVYTEPDKGMVHVHVSAYITKPEERRSVLSNEFVFSFNVNNNMKGKEGEEEEEIEGKEKSSSGARQALVSGSGLRHVIPTTVAEAKLQLEVIDSLVRVHTPPVA
jgi:acyl-coenzyme A thioesterase 9